MTTSHTHLDTLGVMIRVGDLVRVTSWGAPVRLADTGRTARVAGFTHAGNVRLALDLGNASDPIARGKAVSPGMLAVARRDGEAGHEGNAPRVASHVRNPWTNEDIACGECGSEDFFEARVPRSLDYFNHECASCGRISHTMTETGMSA